MDQHHLNKSYVRVGAIKNVTRKAVCDVKSCISCNSRLLISSNRTQGSELHSSPSVRNSQPCIYHLPGGEDQPDSSSLLSCSVAALGGTRVCSNRHANIALTGTSLPSFRARPSLAQSDCRWKYAVHISARCILESRSLNAVCSR